MAEQLDLLTSTASECNRVKIGGTTELFGDPAIRPEKPHTIILFPGGAFEIARTEEGNYWVHVSVREQTDGVKAGRIIRARMDHDRRYNDEGNAALNEAIAAGDTYHIAFLIKPGAAS